MYYFSLILISVLVANTIAKDIQIEEGDWNNLIETARPLCACADQFLRFDTADDCRFSKDFNDKGSATPTNIKAELDSTPEECHCHFIYNNETAFCIVKLGFTRSRSATDAGVQLISHILESWEKSQFAIGIFCDLSKPFDCVDHNTLICKLQQHGICGQAADFVFSYLTKTQQKEKKILGNVVLVSNQDGRASRVTKVETLCKIIKSIDGKVSSPATGGTTTTLKPTVAPTGDNSTTLKPTVAPTGDNTTTLKPTVAPTGDNTTTLKPTVAPTGDNTTTLKPTVAPTGDNTTTLKPTVAPIGDNTTTLKPTVAPTGDNTTTLKPIVTPTGDNTTTLKPTVAPTGDNTTTLKPTVAPTGDNATTLKPTVAPIGDNTTTLKPIVAPTGDNTTTLKPTVAPTGDNTTTLKPTDAPADDNTTTLKPTVAPTGYKPTTLKPTDAPTGDHTTTTVTPAKAQTPKTGDGKTDSLKKGPHQEGKKYPLQTLLLILFCSFGAGILVAIGGKMAYDRYRKRSYVLPPEQGMQL